MSHTPSGKVHLDATSLQWRFSSLMINRTDAQFRLLLRKGFYPYEYMDSWDGFDETRLPPRSAFHKSISDTNISNEDYNHTLTVWRDFNISSMGEYHNLYLLIDVLLLSNTFNELDLFVWKPIALIQRTFTLHCPRTYLGIASQIIANRVRTNN